MTQPSPLTCNSGLRVFSASLLSALLIVMPFVQLAAAQRQRSGVSDQRAEKQESGVRSHGTGTKAAAENIFLNAPIPRPAPAPLIVTAAQLKVTLDDGLSVGQSKRPGETITYTATIQNTNPTDAATNVVFTNDLSANLNLTLVPGSVSTQPIAFSDSYNVIGNVQIAPNAAQGLLTNDKDPDTGNNTGLNVTAEIKSSTQCTGGCSNNVTINADGSFSYNPPAGFAGTDTFTYTITDPTAKTDTGTVTLNVGNGTATPGTAVIWFIDDSAPAGGDGRLTSPFNCYTGTTVPGPGPTCFSDSAADQDGDFIFLFDGNYTGGYTLLNNEKLIGQDATATLASISGFTVQAYSNALPTTDSTPGGVLITATGANNAINLGQGNLLRGFTVGNVGTGAKIFGNGFITLAAGNNTSPDVVLSGAGQALNLTNGTFTATSGFNGVASTSSSGTGVSLSQVAGTVGFGSTTISGSATQGILVSQSTVNLNFGNTAVGTVTAGSGGTDAVSLQNNSSGTRTFGTLTIQNNTGVGFLHSAAGGLVSVTGLTTINNPGGAGIKIQSSTTAVSFADTIVTSSAGLGVELGGTGLANSGAVSFGDLDITPDAAVRAFLAVDNTGTITTTSGTITNTGAATATVDINGPVGRTPLAMVLTSISSDGAGNGILLTDVSGSFASGTTNLQNNTGIGLQVSNSTATFNFGNTTVNSSAGDAVDLSTNTGAITFAALNLTPDANVHGLDASSNSGTITSTSGTISTTDGVAVNIAGPVALTPLSMLLTSVSANNTGTANSCINLTNASGSITMNAGSLTGGTASAFLISGGSASSTYNGTITQSTGGQRAIDVQSKTGGTVSFGGAISANTTTANAIHLVSNASTTMNFTAGLSLTTSSGIGFNATGGGTVNATQNNTSIVNTISSTTGTALNVSSTTIGASGLTFRSITSSGGTNGIVLSTTGSSGGLTVTGNGGTCTTAVSCTGGSIQNKTGDAISLNSTNSVSLTRMFVFTSGGSHVDATTVNGLAFINMYFDTSTDHGILGSTVTTFTADDCMFDRGGFNQSSKHGIFMTNLLGTSSVTDSTFKRSGTIQFFVTNTTRSTAQPAAATDILTLSHNTWNEHTGAFGGDHFSVLAAGTGTASTSSNMKLIVDGTGGENKTGGLLAAGNNEGGNAYNVQATNTGKLLATITAVDAMNVTAGVNVASSTNGTVVFDVFSNKTANGTGFVSTGSSALNLACINSTCTGKFRDNSISHTAPANVNALSIVQEGSGTNTVEVSTNVISGSFQRAIHIQSRLGTGQTNATVTSNTMTATDGTGLQVFNAETGSSTVAPEDYSNKICLNLVTNSATPAGSMDAYRLRNRGPSNASQKCTGCVFQLQNFVGNGSSATDVENWIKLPPKSNTPLAGPFTISIDNAFTSSGGCATPVIAAGPDLAPSLYEVASAGAAEQHSALTAISDSGANGSLAEVARLLNARTAFADRLNFLGNIANSFVSQSATIAAPSAEARPSNLIPVTHRAEISSRPSEARTAEVASLESRAIAHHALNLKPEARDSKSDPRPAHDATVSNVAPRTANMVRAAAPLAGSFTVNIGTLPANDSVTITFQATIANTLTPGSANSVSNQAQVTADGGINKVSDDPQTTPPAAGDGNDATVTPIDKFEPVIDIQSSDTSTDQGESVTFTATLTHGTALVDPLPTGTVDFIDQGNAEVLCNDVPLTVNVSNSTAPCTTTDVDAGTRTIAAVYSGDGRYDTATDTVVQTVTACGVNPVVTKIADTNDGTCDADCSLREAIATVCSAAGNNTVTFATGAGQAFENPATITLSASFGNLTIDRNMTIRGPSHGVTVVGSGNASHRVFVVNPSKTATITNMTIKGGNSDAIGGGGILNDGTLTLKNVTVSDNNSTWPGGGIRNTNALNVVNSTINNNLSSDGGGIVQDGTSPTLTMINATVSGNKSNGSAGGVYVINGTATIINSTITGNFADFDDNSSGEGGGLRRNGGTLTIHNTIVAGNFDVTAATNTPDDIEGTVDVASSYNLIGEATTAGGLTNGGNGNIVGAVIANVLDTVLANNGGLTNTHRLITGSPALDAGNNANLPADTFDLDGDANVAETLPVDQRGVAYPRVADSSDAANTTDNVDIGAFEAHPDIENIPDKSTAEDTAFNFNFNIGDDSAGLITSVAASSSNATLAPNANLIETDGTANDGVWNLQITPAANANSPADLTATITVTVTASNGRTTSDTFVLTVTEVNDNPVPSADTISDVAEDSGTYVIPFATLLGNDTNKGATNESGQTVDITAVSSPTGGTVAINGTNVEFTPTANFFGAAGFTYTVTDNGTTSGASDPKTGNATVSFNVTAVNDPPSFTIAADPPAVNEDAGAQTVNAFATSISQGPGETGQTLTFNISPTGSTGTLTFSSGPAIDTTTGDLTYTPTANTNGTASFSVTLSDNGGGTDTSAAQTFTITVNAQNDAPVVTTTGGNLAYTENDPATAIDTGLTVTDVDSANLTEASASITTNFQSGQDVLGWVDNNAGDNITLSGTSTAQTIVLTGTDTPANYQAALRAVTYQNTSENPSTLTRTVTFTANDGTNTGQGTRGIGVTAVNDDPTLATNAGLTVVNSGTGTIDNTKLKVDDVDNTPVQITFTVGTAPTNGTLKKGVATLTAGGTFTQADIDSNQITYTHNGIGTSDSFTFTFTDGTAAANGPHTFNITIATNVSINDAKVTEPSPVPNTVDMTFTVALNAPASAPVTVDFITNNGSAASGTCPPIGSGDYTSTNGQVSFSVGQQVKTINVSVCSDNNNAEGDETFTVTLSNPSGATIIDGTATGTIKVAADPAGEVLISEIRTRGPGGLGDDFVELYNNSNSPKDISGYGLFKKGTDCNVDSPVLIATIPGAPGSNTTVIPARGHYLLVGSQYSLTSYPGGNDGTNPTTATGNQTLSADLETDANVGLFSTADPASISTLNRVDAVGFGANVGGTCNLLREGSLLPSIVGNETTEHSYFRKMCEWTQGQGCTLNGQTKDTNNNSVDFWLADTGAITGRLGAPGPENLTAPIRRDNATNPGVGGIAMTQLDGNVGAGAAANRKRDTTEGMGSTPTQFGTMTLRYRVTNTTANPVTRLRYRIVDISTAVQPPGPVADLRALTGVLETGPTAVGPVTDSATCTSQSLGTPCTVTVNQTTLEAPSTQAVGGGYNSTLSSGTIGLGPSALQPGSSILINFKFGVQSTGQFRFYIIIEALH